MSPRARSQSSTLSPPPPLLEAGAGERSCFIDDAAGWPASKNMAGEPPPGGRDTAAMAVYLNCQPLGRL